VKTPSGDEKRNITPSAGSGKFPNLLEYVDSSSDNPGNTNVSNDDGEAERVVIEERFQIQFAVDSDFMKKFNTVRSLLSTKYPKGMTFETVFGEMMDEYLDRHSPEKRIERRKSKNRRNAGRKSKQSGAESAKKHAEKASRDDSGKETKKGRDACSGIRSRHIPASVRDEVYARDGGRCAFVGGNGRRCNSQWNLQIDHIVPYARGGDSSPGNLRLHCARHNRLAAEREYGKDYMKKFCRRE
jgi:hypothetical protein